MRSRILSLTALLLPAALCGTVAADESIDAERIYQESCSVCHGDDGRGAVWGQASLATPPRNFRTEASRNELTRERMIASVTAGRPGTPMPGFGTQLSIEQIMAVVDYIRGEFMAAPKTAGGHAAMLPGNTEYGPIGGGDVQRDELPSNLAGDAAQGALLYAQNCVDCHGANGGGDGRRAYFIFPKPRNFNDPGTQQYLTRENLYNGIKYGVIGKEMPAWGNVLSDGQIADLTEYVYRQFIANGRSGETD
jgi:mono/diheme cytochrome c family protein